MKKHWLVYLISMIFVFCMALLLAGKAWLISPVLDRITSGSITTYDLIVFCFVVASVLAAQALFSWLYHVTARKASAGMARDLRRDIFKRLSNQSLGYFSERSSGDIIGRIVQDVYLFEGCAVLSSQHLLKDITQICCLLSLLIWLDWKVAVGCLLILGLIGLILKSMSKKITKLVESTQREMGELNSKLNETISGIDCVMALGLKSRTRENFFTITQNIFQLGIKRTGISYLSVFSIMVAAAVGLSSIVYLTGTALISGNLSLGEFGTFLAAIYLMQTPILDISHNVSSISEGLAALNRSTRLLEDKLSISSAVSDDYTAPESMHIEFKEISFAYKNDTVLSNLSFSIIENQIVTILGDSGAGKSTLVKLLMRFYDPSAGTITLDGKDIKQFPLDDLYQYFSYVSQDIFLFSGTIEFNIKIGCLDITEHEFKRITKIACIDEFVEKIPDGYQTLVGERGIRLSGGQRQRIAIARALIMKPRVIIFDEATSALDTDHERRILQNIVNNFPNTTIIAVTHRLALAEIADNVYVLKSGKLAEKGKAKTLYSQNGEFTRLKNASKKALVREEISENVLPLGITKDNY